MEKKKPSAAAVRQAVPVIEADPEVGLTAAQASTRAHRGWRNLVSDTAGRTEGQIIKANCLTFFNMVFAVMAVLMLLVGSSPLNLTFLAVAVINTVIGSVQEIRAKRAVDKLTLVASGRHAVIRDGTLLRVRSDLLVRDDIVEFRTGEQICADGVVCAGQMLVNESLITGEADAIAKVPGDLLRSGSFVISGTARARLTAVGDDAFAARLAAEAKKDPTAAKSDMMRSLDKLIRVIGILLIPVGIALFINQIQHPDATVRTGVESTVAALVGMIPEGLYLLTSIALAVSAIKLTRKRVLVQDMNCIEILAQTDVLCVDKTGTITEPVMELDQVIPLTEDPPEYLEAVMTALYGCIEPENDTAKALFEMFRGESDWNCVRRIPFDSRLKWSAAEFENHGAFFAGAPEFLMGARYDELREKAESWSGAGYRVLLVARYDGELRPETPDAGRVVPLALLALTNRIRPDAPDTFRYFAKQGVTVKVISGDNPVTVADVARRAGIGNADRYIDAATLDTPEQIAKAAESYTVFGRVTPEKKKLLVAAMKRAGHTVAMTGDGVNDVLAMKEADCGIAMASGAQAASQVARLVLLDSDFSAMPGIVGEGRRVINNIRRAATLFLVKNIFSLGLSVVTLFTGLQYPLESFHLSIVSALTIGAPGFFLALEPNHDKIKGRFLPVAVRRALPGALTDIAVVLTAQAFMATFALPLQDAQSICAAILCVVGLSVLFRVCMPFSALRKFVWGAMASCVVLAFVFLPSLTGYLKMEQKASWLIMLAVLIMVPTVFYALSRVFDRADALLHRFGKKRH